MRKRVDKHRTMSPKQKRRDLSEKGRVTEELKENQDVHDACPEDAGDPDMPEVQGLSSDDPGADRSEEQADRSFEKPAEDTGGKANGSEEGSAGDGPEEDDPWDFDEDPANGQGDDQECTDDPDDHAGGGGDPDAADTGDGSDDAQDVPDPDDADGVEDEDVSDPSPKKIIRITAIILIAVIILVAGIFYFLGVRYYEDRWYENTVINGTDYSGKTLSETVDEIESCVNGYSITITGRNGSVTIFGSDFSMEAEAKEELAALFEEQHKANYLSAILNGQDESSVQTVITYDEDELVRLFEESSLVADGEEPEDACIVWDEETSMYVIEEEAEGSLLIERAADDDLIAAVSDLETEFTLTDAYYESPSVTSDDESLISECTTANAYILHWITWEIADSMEELDPETIKDWVSVSDEGEAVIDTEALYDWLEDLCLKYKTVGSDRTFTTHDGEVITVSGGDYGWRIDYDTLCEDTYTILSSINEEAVSAYIEDPTDETRAALTSSPEVTFTSTGYQTGDVDWDPDNYSEVDISEQKVYVYQDGEPAYSCICVTGLPDGERDTTTGVWYIKDKKETYTMTSETYGYTTPTKYWIRITWTGIGYHYMARSDWGSWSSSLYKSAGSHGCVNLQLESAKTIYSLVSIGDAVIIHK